MSYDVWRCGLAAVAPVTVPAVSQSHITGRVTNPTPSPICASFVRNFETAGIASGKSIKYTIERYRRLQKGTFTSICSCCNWKATFGCFGLFVAHPCLPRWIHGATFLEYGCSRSDLTWRRATHADSWYTGNRRRICALYLPHRLHFTGKQLDSQLASWLSGGEPDENIESSPPIRGCKAIISPSASH